MNDNQQVIESKRNKPLSEKRKEQFKQYRLRNLETLKQKQGEKIMCPHGCGASFRRSGLSQHLKTKKHKKYMETSQ